MRYPQVARGCPGRLRATPKAGIAPDRRVHRVGAHLAGQYEVGVIPGYRPTVDTRERRATERVKRTTVATAHSVWAFPGAACRCAIAGERQTGDPLQDAMDLHEGQSREPGKFRFRGACAIERDEPPIARLSLIDVHDRCLHRDSLSLRVCCQGRCPRSRPPCLCGGERCHQDHAW